MIEEQFIHMFKYEWKLVTNILGEAWKQNIYDQR